jgi:hypothetical protein
MYLRVVISSLAERLEKSPFCHSYTSFVDLILERESILEQNGQGTLALLSHWLHNDSNREQEIVNK